MEFDNEELENFYPRVRLYAVCLPFCEASLNRTSALKPAIVDLVYRIPLSKHHIGVERPNFRKISGYRLCIRLVNAVSLPPVIHTHEWDETLIRHSPTLGVYIALLSDRICRISI